MFKVNVITSILLIAIPVALFSQRGMDAGIVRNITNITAAVLILLVWETVKKFKLRSVDRLLLKTYLVGLLVFSFWLGLNFTVISTYDSSFTHSRDAWIRSSLLRAEPFIVYVGLTIALVFIVLCLTRIFITIRDHHRHNRKLKASNV